MYVALGQLIRERREMLGLDQASIATQLSIRRQTVSGWEAGRSRPRRSMLNDLSQVLALNEETLVDAGGYRSPAPTTRPPVRPLARVLPLDELTEERFEDLLTEIIATLYPDGHASRYGGRGHKQYGIDVLVTSDGINIATGQCKRHREFGPAAVRKAISEVTIAASKNYLFLSRHAATPAARAEAGKHTGWELWDGEDISRYIRGLPREQALRIVDTYFHGHRESFLGILTPGPWLLPEEYFDAARATIFNHEWNLAGRQCQLTQLIDTAYAADATLTIATGAGGVGKTRLLKALADAAPVTAEVRLLSGDARVSAADFELLPHQAGLTVIIDDAHELTEVSGVASGIWLRNPKAKIVFAMRPYGRQSLVEELARRGLLPMAHTEVELTDLDFDDAIALAREALGGETSEAITLRLASLTVDSPLATVVGGVLIRQGRLNPSALEQDDNVRFHIMRGFRDALVNDSRSADPATRIAVINAISALQPFRSNESTARESLSAIVGKPYDELRNHLSSLENAGILRRRLNSLRIVPDLLGDVILAEAAFDDAGSLSTGYLERIEPLVSGSSTEHLFVNVSRIDWQVRKKDDGAPSLADSLWEAFFTRVKTSDLIDRRDLIKALTKVAYFQPARVLAVTRWLIDNPTHRLAPEHSAWRTLLSTDYNSVLHALPSALKFAAMNADSLPEALNQLWDLARRDEHPVNQNPEHAIRVTRELAEFGVAKPIWFIDKIIDIVTSWFGDAQQLSPFEALEPILATEGEDSHLRDHTLRFRPYSLDPQSVTRVRQRVIDLAFREISSQDLRRSGAAAKFLQSALRYPTGRFGREVSNDERERWTPGFVETIERLGAIAANGDLDAAVLVSIREALHWHENYGSGPAHDAAEKAIASLPRTVETNLGLVLHDGWGRLVRDRNDSYEAIEAKRLELIDNAIDSLANLNDEEVVDLVTARLHADREVHGPSAGNPKPCISSLIKARPTLGQALLERLRMAPSPGALEPVLPVILGTFAVFEPATALDYVRELLASTAHGRKPAAAQAIGWNRGHRDLHPGELDLLLQLAVDPDTSVRRNVAGAAQMLAPSQTEAATRLLAALRFGDDPLLADDIFMYFRLDLGISWSNFSKPELELIRQDLVDLPKIDGDSVSKALARRSASDAPWVVELLKARIERAESLDSFREYCALPYSWDNPLQIRGTEGFLSVLQGILSWIANDIGSWSRQDSGAVLFAAVASTYDSQIVDFLSDALSSRAENTTIAVTAVLKEAHRTFIWDQTEFVITALHAADRFGEEVLRNMVNSLWNATISGIRSGTLGEPFSETIEQRDRSRNIAKALPYGSIEKQFYTDIAKSADKDIASAITDGLPSDGRTW